MRVMNSVTSLEVVQSPLAPLVEAALAENGGLPRQAPGWGPRSFLQPGKRASQRNSLGMIAKYAADPSRCLLNANQVRFYTWKCKEREGVRN